MVRIMGRSDGQFAEKSEVMRLVTGHLSLRTGHWGGEQMTSDQWVMTSDQSAEGPEFPDSGTGSSLEVRTTLP